MWAATGDPDTASEVGRRGMVNVLVLRGADGTKRAWEAYRRFGDPALSIGLLRRLLKQLLLGHAFGFACLARRAFGLFALLLQSRLLRLDAGARRTLRAASIFGQTFWYGGLDKILRTEPGNLDVDHWLHVLIEGEILEPQKDSRFPEDRQYRFRHALLRDAAYSLLTHDHKQLGHRMAAPGREPDRPLRHSPVDRARRPGRPPG